MLCHPKGVCSTSALSLMVLVIFNVWISSLGILGMDLLSITPVVYVTLFATVGVVNAFNLIDGLNGLSSYITISTAFAFLLFHSKLKIFKQFFLYYYLLLGFFVFNFPFGKIFLGDGGAYILGHLLVYGLFLLISDQTKISTFSIPIFFWPVADTGLYMAALENRSPADHPDRLHFHRQ